MRLYRVSMPIFRIDAVASYPATEPMTYENGYALMDSGPALKPPNEVFEALWTYWSNREQTEDTDRLRVVNVGVAEDGTFLPSRLTMTVACDIDAPTEFDARIDAMSLFREECEAEQLPTPETVVANEADED